MVCDAEWSPSKAVTMSWVPGWMSGRPFNGTVPSAKLRVPRMGLPSVWTKRTSAFGRVLMAGRVLVGRRPLFEATSFSAPPPRGAGAARRRGLGPSNPRIWLPCAMFTQARPVPSLDGILCCDFCNRLGLLLMCHLPRYLLKNPNLRRLLFGPCRQSSKSCWFSYRFRHNLLLCKAS